jgi:quercetin dioxygenase-like cupin family protein
MKSLVRPTATVLMLLALAQAPAPLALGQDLPPGPTPLDPLGRAPIIHLPEQFEETQQLVLDFAPGEWTPAHSYGGSALVRVLAGEMTRGADGVEDVFQAGQGWDVAPGAAHTFGNNGADPARVLVSLLLPRGAPLTTVDGAPSDLAPPGPTVAFQSQRVEATGGALQIDEVATTTLGFAPGAWTPWHWHSGLTLVGVMDGEMTVNSGGIETIYRAGDLWIEQPGDVHAAGNTTGADARVAVTFLQDRGAPVTTPAERPAAARVHTARSQAAAGPTGSEALFGAVAVTALLAGVRPSRVSRTSSTNHD